MGRRQVFIRLAGCNLNCAYCDTACDCGPHCNVYCGGCSIAPYRLDNPLQIAQVMTAVTGLLTATPHHSCSITGGEPLLHAAVLEKLLPQLTALVPVQLETNGTLAAELERVLPWLRWVSMDIKLESVTAAPTPWAQHGDFLRLAAKVNCAVKLVIGPATTDAELEQATRLMAATAPQVTVIIQPLTSNGRSAVSAMRLLQCQQLMTTFLTDVRIIPQTHQFLSAP